MPQAVVSQTRIWISVKLFDVSRLRRDFWGVCCMTWCYWKAEVKWAEAALSGWGDFAECEAVDGAGAGTSGCGRSFHRDLEGSQETSLRLNGVYFGERGFASENFPFQISTVDCYSALLYFLKVLMQRRLPRTLNVVRVFQQWFWEQPESWQLLDEALAEERSRGWWEHGSVEVTQAIRSCNAFLVCPFLNVIIPSALINLIGKIFSLTVCI